jgi:plasmid stabilization system protein ParE
MYAVMILEEAHEDLKNIVSYIANENPSAAETLGGELLDAAMRLNRCRSRFPSQETARPFKTDPRAASDLLPRSGTEKSLSKSLPSNTAHRSK